MNVYFARMQRFFVLALAFSIERSAVNRGPAASSLATKILCTLFGALIAVTCQFAPSSALALDPGRSLAQLKQTEWGADRGAPPGIFKISQGVDGFLWLATAGGLYRFDGISFELIPGIAGDLSRSTQLTAVLAARDGAIWAGHYKGGVSVYRGGVMRDANHGPPTGVVFYILQAPNGSIFVGTDGHNGAQITRYLAGRWSDVGVTLGLPSGTLEDMKIAQDGTLWVVVDQTICALVPKAKRYVTAVASKGGGALAASPDGRMWAIDVEGARPLSLPMTLTPTSNGPNKGSYRGNCSLFDSDGNLFICEPDHGLKVLRPIKNGDEQRGGASESKAFTTINLKNNSPLSIFEDVEHNIWVGTSTGLEQIRSANVVLDPVKTSSESGAPRMVSSRRGALFFGDGNELDKSDSEGNFKPIAHLGNPSDQIEAMCSDGGDGVWVGLSKTLHHWHGGHFTLLTPPPEWGGQLIVGCAVDGGGDLWASILRKGLFRRHSGVWKTVVLDASRPNAWPPLLHIDSKGRLLAYVAYRSLYEVDDGTVSRLGSTEDIGVGYVRTLENGTSGILLGGESGLSRYDGRTFKVIPSEQHPWLSSLSGILETADGFTWLNGARGIAKVRTSDLNNAFNHTKYPIKHELFDLKDGLQGSVLNFSNFEGAKGSDGRLWFQTNNGRLWIEPSHLHRNPKVPPVVIKSITAANRIYVAKDRLILPKGVRSLQIDYTALSLTVPERVRFRYRLREVDKDWVDAGPRRQAFYTNLSPGSYHFDVIAANNDDVWNLIGATLFFSISPSFWQTPVFVAAAVVAALVLLWLLYRLRIKQVAQRVKIRLEDRLGERERIARELHDTLLQGFQSLAVRFQSAVDRIPPTDPVRGQLEEALDRADQVLIEGRDKVLNLRTEKNEGDLALSIEVMAYRLRTDPAITINMIVKGASRPIGSTVADEILAIANEALFNAFAHARASQIEITIAFQKNGIRLGVADNGVGIASMFLEGGGRQGHFGLLGMKERAKNLQSGLRIDSDRTGTRIILTVPKKVSYGRRAALTARI